MNSKRIINLVALVVGVTALGFLIYKVGLDELLENLMSFGAAFPLILLVEAFSNVFSCFGWYYSFEPAHRPSYGRLLYISFASLSLAGALPTGQAGEVAKGNMLRGHSKPTEILSSLLIYNYFHIFTTLLMVVIGPFVALAVGSFETRIVLITMGVAFASFTITLILGGVPVLGDFAQTAGENWQNPVHPLAPLREDARGNPSGGRAPPGHNPPARLGPGEGGSWGSSSAGSSRCSRSTRSSTSWISPATRRCR